MRTRRFFTAGFIAIGTLAFAAQASVTLQRTLVANTTDTYKITSKLDQTINSPQLGEMPMKVTSGMTCKLQTNKVDAAKGSADVEVTTSVDTIDAGSSPLAAMLTGKTPPPVVQDGTIDKLGHLALKNQTGGDPTISAIMGASGNMQAAMFVELPDHAVKVGDSWDIVIPKGQFTGDSDQKITVKLTGEKKVDTKDAWTVELSGTINIAFDSSSLPSGSESSSPLGKTQVVVKGATVIQGNGTIDKATGKTLTLDSTGTIKTNVELHGSGDFTAETGGTVSTSVKLQG